MLAQKVLKEQVRESDNLYVNQAALWDKQGSERKGE